MAMSKVGLLILGLLFGAPRPTTSSCPDGYKHRTYRHGWGVGRIVVVPNDAACAERCTTYSGVQFSGGCKGYMYGPWYGLTLCRCYGGNAFSPCISWADCCVNSTQLSEEETPPPTPSPTPPPATPPPFWGGTTTCGGTGGGTKCAFPFTHNGVTHQACTSQDHTEEWCNAVNGGWGNCNCGNNPPNNCGGTRVRRSWYALSFAERTTYTTAFQRLVSGAAGNNLRQRYITLIDMHMMQWTASGIHTGRQFLPWHRWYLIQIENLLREIDCTITIPYWPWENEASRGNWNSAFWDANGGFGQGWGNNCVANGPFRQGQYSLTALATPFSGRSCLRRARTGFVPTRSEVDYLQTTSSNDFDSYSLVMDTMHGTVHCSVDGTMCERITYRGLTSFTAANAPEFWLHHSNVDRLWHQWQSQSASHQTSYYPGENPQMPQTGGLRVSSVLNSLSMSIGSVSYDSTSEDALPDVGQEFRTECPPRWLSNSLRWFNGTETEEALAARVATVTSYLCNATGSD